MKESFLKDKRYFRSNPFFIDKHSAHILLFLKKDFSFEKKQRSRYSADENCIKEARL